MKHSYIIIDDDPNSVLKTKAIADGFQMLQYLGTASDYEAALDLILEVNPTMVFLEINPIDSNSRLSLQLISELYRYLKTVPKIIITTNNPDSAIEAIKYEVLDYFVKPLTASGFRKALLKFEKTAVFGETVNTVPIDTAHRSALLNDLEVSQQEIQKEALPEMENQDVSEAVLATSDVQETDQQTAEVSAKQVLSEDTKSKDEKPLIICVKSYGDYRFIEAKDICYLQADNNSTDIHLYNGEMITAFKTLKHFEGVLTSPFVRIHNSYIVNIDYVSRIHTGNAVCYIKNTTIKLPFSKSYKENVDSIINSITTGNYLEI